MRVLVAGATGVIGAPLLPLLSAVGHDVIAMVRPGGRTAGDLVRHGATQVVTADALDRAAVARAVREAAPDAVINMLTSIPAKVDPRRLARDFAVTDRLRTEGTRNLIESAHDAGASHIISQGLAYAYDPAPAGAGLAGAGLAGAGLAGAGLADEDAPLWRNPPKQFVPVLAALVELERLTREAGGLVLRFGHLYGPGSAFAADGSFTEQVRAGKVPIVGNGGSVFSFTHAHDAATAVVAALGRQATGVLNIVDDTPAPVSEWLPALARLLGAPEPKRVPAALARMAVGGWGVAYMNGLRGAGNHRARLALDWRPRYTSYKDGFAELAAAPGAART